MLSTFALVAAAVAVGLAGLVLEASRPGVALSAELVCLAVGFAGGAALGFPAGWICRGPGRGPAEATVWVRRPVVLPGVARIRGRQA